MATKLLYMDDFDVTSAKTRVREICTSEDGRSIVILNETCFYPRGGGQDWDRGTIESATSTFTVEEVRLDAGGVVHHVGAFNGEEFSMAEAVTCKVDTARRAVNTRLHSAGHLVDMAVDKLGLPWKPVRGAHYPHMSFVEYEGELAPEAYEQTQADITKIAAELAATETPNELRYMPPGEMHTVCRHVPENLPANKPGRVVIYGGTFGVPCGGTHVRALQDIGAVRVTKVKAKKGLIKVSYGVDGIN